ncbi:uncharacterized protein LOC109370163 [Meleagris gallopavo]|uniref:uncharacterized protein LOC109370163 n=1 Tax=Meleagris gallopavo TaxID=9103 RepID=UPI00094014A3|nr:uncharacterized protein LOC109370163 [Meleagris gallopavo]
MAAMLSFPSCPSGRFQRKSCISSENCQGEKQNRSRSAIHRCKRSHLINAPFAAVCLGCRLPGLAAQSNQERLPISPWSRKEQQKAKAEMSAFGVLRPPLVMELLQFWCCLCSTARNEVCGWPEPPVGCFSTGVPQWGCSKPLLLAVSVPAQLPAIAAHRGTPWSAAAGSRRLLSVGDGFVCSSLPTAEPRLEITEQSSTLWDRPPSVAGLPSAWVQPRGFGEWQQHCGTHSIAVLSSGLSPHPLLSSKGHNHCPQNAVRNYLYGAFPESPIKPTGRSNCSYPPWLLIAQSHAGPRAAHKVRPGFQFIQFNTCETRYISF